MAIDEFGVHRPNKDKRWDSLNLKPGGVFHGKIGLGNGTQWEVVLYKTKENEVICGVPNHGCNFVFPSMDVNYLMGRIAMLPGDAGNFLDFIVSAIGTKKDLRNHEPQGNYYDKYMDLELPKEVLTNEDEEDEG